MLFKFENLTIKIDENPLDFSFNFFIREKIIKFAFGLIRLTISLEFVTFTRLNLELVSPYGNNRLWPMSKSMTVVNPHLKIALVVSDYVINIYAYI